MLDKIIVSEPWNYKFNNGTNIAEVVVVDIIKVNNLIRVRVRDIYNNEYILETRYTFESIMHCKNNVNVFSVVNNEKFERVSFVEPCEELKNKCLKILFKYN